MTLAQALSEASRMLSNHGMDSPSLISELLLRHVLKINQVLLYLDLNKILTQEQETSFFKLIERSLKGEPAAYIIGLREFYGLDFYVDPRVLIPRPETELLVDVALDIAKKHDISVIADIGTGCGAIAICLALKLPEDKIYAIDISASALEVASININKYGLERRICLLHGDLLEPLPDPVDLIIANLPYVKTEEIVPGSPISFEPRLALDGGRDGLDIIRKLLNQVSRKLRPGGHLLIEIGVGQAEAITNLIHSLYPSARVEIKKDLSRIERVVLFNMP